MKRTRYPEPDEASIALRNNLNKGISIPGADLNPTMSNFAVEYAISGDIDSAIHVSGLEVPALRKNKEQFIQELISDPAIQAVMQSIKKDKTITHLITHEKIQHEYAKIAFVDPAECFNENGSLLSVKDMPHYVRAAIKEVKHSTTVQGEGEDKKTTYNTVIKFHSKMEALKILDQPYVLENSNDAPAYQDNRKVVNINVNQLSDAEIELAGKLINITPDDNIKELECFEARGASG